MYFEPYYDQFLIKTYSGLILEIKSSLFHGFWTKPKFKKIEKYLSNSLKRIFVGFGKHNKWLPFCIFLDYYNGKSSRVENDLLKG